MLPARIDLHAHSTASDGTLSPGELVRAAAAAGLDVLALTDHDSHAGIAEAAEALPSGLTLLAGAEISCVAQLATGPVSLHLLAYLADPAHPAYAEALARLRTSRVGRAERMIAMLRTDGYDVSWDRVVADADGGTVGRPHVAREMVAAGIVGATAQAFGPGWIGRGGRYHLDKDDLPVLEAIGLVRAAGGVPVFAHPGAHQKGPVVDDATIAAMAQAGLAGLEVDHADHDLATRRRLRGLAADLGLLVTGSSDFHGSEQDRRLGGETTAPVVYEALLAQASGAAPLSV